MIFNSEPTFLVRFPMIPAVFHNLTFLLGHYYFTTLLIPALLAGAKSSPDGKARVVNTSSSASVLTSGVNFNTLKDTPARKKYSTSSLYAQSKLVGVSVHTRMVPFTNWVHQGNVLFSNELQRRYGDQGIVSTSLNPGNLKSDLQRHLSWTETLFIVSIYSLI